MRMGRLTNLMRQEAVKARPSGRQHAPAQRGAARNVEHGDATLS
jgi:hypothetical protein